MFISFNEIYTKAIALFDDPKITKAYNTNQIQFKKLMYTFLQNAIALFTNPVSIGTSLVNYAPPFGKMEIFTYVLSVAALMATAVCVIHKNAAGANACFMSAIALFLSGRSIRTNMKNQEKIKELCEIIMKMLEMRKEELLHEHFGIK